MPAEMSPTVQALLESHVGALLQSSQLQAQNATAHAARVNAISENGVIIAQQAAAAAVRTFVETELGEAVAGKHLATGNAPAESQIAAKNAGNTPPVTPSETFTRAGAQESEGGA